MNMVCTPSVSRSLPHTKSNWGFYKRRIGYEPPPRVGLLGPGTEHIPLHPPHPGWAFRQKGRGTGSDSCACAHLTAVRVPILHLADPGREAWRMGTRGLGQKGE